MVEEGSFTIFDDDENELARVGKGSCFGELALLRQVGYSSLSLQTYVQQNIVSPSYSPHPPATLVIAQHHQFTLAAAHAGGCLLP